MRFTLFALLVIACSCVFSSSGGSGGLRAQDLYDLDRTVEVELEMHDKHWKKKLIAWKKENLGTRITATLKVDGVVYDSVGVRFKGNSSYYATVRSERRKLPFNIKVSHTDKEQMVDGKYRTLKLSNLFRDPSYVREALSYDIANDYMVAPRCNYARLTVDGDYFGIYNLTESVDEEFWANRFDWGGDKDKVTMFKCDPESKDPPPTYCPPDIGASLKYLGEDSLCYYSRYELKKMDVGWSELIGLTEQLADEQIKPETYLNVDEALWMLAFDNALVNLDSYIGAFCHNYYLYRDNSGYWRPVIWDLNLSFGGFRLLSKEKVLSDKEMVELSPFLHFGDEQKRRPLIERLFSRPLFRKMYVAHLETIFREQFESGEWRKRAEKIRNHIAEEVAEEPHPLYPFDYFESNYTNAVKTSDGPIIGLAELVAQRTAYLKVHPLYKKSGPEIADQSAIRDGDTTNVSVTLGDEQSAEAVWVAHRTKGRGGFTFSELSTEADGTYNLSLPAEQVEEYFVIAEGRINASVLPARSGVEWFTVE